MPLEPPTILRLSTSDVAPARRLNYWSSILSSTFTPVAVDNGNPYAYESEMAAVQLGPITFAEQRGSAQRCIRASREISQTTEHCFNLVLVLGGAWQVTHGARMRCGPGDLIFHDSRYPLEVDLLESYSDIFLHLSEEFVRKWLPNPTWLIGRQICRDSQWGRVLSSYVAQLSPDFVVQAPLPLSVLTDQIGALLTLTATELRGGRPTEKPAERSVRDEIHDYVKQRCPEASLQAADIATSLNISTRTLHRTLAACGETFGAVLMQARVDVAVRLLRSPHFDRVTTAQIGRRAGFSDASHFARVLRRRTGQTPLQMRKTKGN
jgi:AraC family transcriptional regulator, positive regulator of tynA and feaB